MNTTDSIGNVLAVGDTVVSIPENYRVMVKAEVIGFTPKQVRLKFVDHYSIDNKTREQCRPYNYVVKV